MPKKTAYSRNVAQRNKTKQKSFELVRSASSENVLEATPKSEKLSLANQATPEVEEVEEEEEYEAEEVEEEVVVKKAQPIKKEVPARDNLVTASVSANHASKSAAARLAERRKAEQKEKPLRSSANLILAENYSYVRKDLVFILILAIIMFSAIIIMHFVPAIGG
jgi:hypothetical protein